MAAVFSPQRSGGTALFAVQRGVVDGSVVTASIAATGAMLYSGTVSMSVDVIAAPPGTITASVAALGSVVYSGTVSMSADVVEYVPRCIVPFTTNGATPAANVSGIRWAWWDASPPDLSIAPVVSGTGESTDAAGVFSVDLTGTTLAYGDTGTLLAVIADGIAGSGGNTAFCAPVEVS